MDDIRAYLKMLGNPVLEAGLREHPLAAERRHQLLAYLACHDGWAPRGELAALFWESHAPEAARRNLRRLLHDIRRMPWASALQGDGDSLRWQIDSDVADFHRARARNDWREAARLGAGTLLEGLEAGATEAFHEWLRHERERHLRRWRDSVANRRNELRDDAQARVALSLHALAHDPLDEAAVEDLLHTLPQLGREDEARRIHEDFARRLQAELGVAAAAQPSPVKSPPRGSRHELIGRRLEQAQLLALLRRDECRRLTIHGPCGVGKTRLARASLDLLREDFPDGVIWIAPGLAPDPLESLADRIASGRVLLVLDDCEHLPGVREAGDLLLERCTGLKILHTSGARIGCDGEWVLPLAGLPVPDADETEWDVLATFDAVRLFERRALQEDPAFDAKRHGADIVALVRAVEGLPLAIETAAACARMLPVREIVADLSRIVDLPAPPIAGAASPSSRKTLRARFQHSWQRLARHEQVALARLAAFGDSFCEAAAGRVAGTRLPVIAALADKSLVSCSGDGRFSLHPLVRLLAIERLGDVAPTPA
jgi:DNA-binding SARP family transcriptional activator